jgi:hypothetical protein
MIPPVVGEETASPGEKELFERFRTDPGAADWVVLHSLDVPRHRRQLMGEIDFTIVVPGQGVLCLEVKSHRSVGRDADGMWHLGHDMPTRVGPFRQASDATHSLRDYVRTRAPELRGLLFWSAVCFTNVRFQLTSPAEWHDWQVIDSAALRARSISALVAAVLARARALAASTQSAAWFNATNAEPTAEQVTALVRIMRPTFEFFESPKSRRRYREDELRRYTAEQYDALDAMDPSANPRVVFEGAAGTGKTLLALEEARRSQLRGKRALLCCFNRLLGSWLRREAEPLGDAVVATTFHSYLLQLTRLEVPEASSAAFWTDELPEAALDVILSGKITPFDILIIDEAQDLLLDGYLDIFDVLVNGGLANGLWRMFGDFEQQSLYGSSSRPLVEVLAQRAPGTPRYMLTKNCRNTPRIASFVKLLAAYDRGYATVLRPDNGIEPELIFYGSQDEQDVKLETLLNSLFADGYSGREIVVISPRARGGAAERLYAKGWADRLKPAAADLPGGIRYCTVHAFKGLESPVVILTDIASIGTAADHSLFYVAVTRATERLYVLASSQVKAAVLDLLLRQPGVESSP